jgi:hypothetical protein
MVWHIGPVNEYEAQIAVISSVVIIRKKMSCDNNATQILSVGVLRHRKKADFNRRQNVQPIVRSQYRY